MACIKKYAPNQSLPINENTLFPGLDVNHTADNITRLGYSLGTSLPEKQVNQILDYCRDKRLKSYENPHKDCALVNNIVHDHKIIEVARRYLQVEPILYKTRIYWSFPEHNHRPLMLSPKEFHYDVGDFKSLALFIYLTDVDADCGPHVLIERTHHKTFAQLLSPCLSYKTAIKKYGEQIRVITGGKGTNFFEDMTCYHQHSYGVKPRLVLTASYAFHRKPGG